MPRRPAVRATSKRPRRILVEPVDQLGPAALVREPVEQPVKMLVGLGAALGREARRLVEHERGGILVDHHVANKLLLVLAQRVAPGLPPRRGAVACRGAARGFPGPPRRGRQEPHACRDAQLPVRAQRETRLKLTSGKCRLNQRSRRMPSSSSVTVKDANVAHASAIKPKLGFASRPTRTPACAACEQFAALVPSHRPVNPCLVALLTHQPCPGSPSDW